MLLRNYGNTNILKNAMNKYFTSKKLPDFLYSDGKGVDSEKLITIKIQSSS